MSALHAVPATDQPIDHPLLRGLSRGRLESLIGPVRPRLVRAGRVLHRPGVRGTEIHLVITGVVRAFELNIDGREALVELIGAGGLDGVVGAPGRRDRVLQALEDSVVLSLIEEQVEGLMSDAGVAAALTRLLLRRIKFREDQLRLTAVREPPRRLAMLLLMLADRFGRELEGDVLIDTRLTHQMLADLVGFRRETVTHALHLLSRRSAIRMRSGRLLANRRALRQLVRTSMRPAGRAERRRGVAANR